MPLTSLKEYLAGHDVEYSSIPHSTTYTAEGTAKSAHIPAKNLAKTVIVKVDGRMAMAVVPASFHVSFDLLKEALGAGHVELAVEKDFEDMFPGCEVGAMPPFGNLYGLEVFVAHSLSEDEEIAFNAGSHTEVLRMKYKDLERLVRPTVLRFATQPV